MAGAAAVAGAAMLEPLLVQSVPQIVLVCGTHLVFTIILQFIFPGHQQCLCIPSALAVIPLHCLPVL